MGEGGQQSWQAAGGRWSLNGGRWTGRGPGGGVETAGGEGDTLGDPGHGDAPGLGMAALSHGPRSGGEHCDSHTGEHNVTSAL